VDVLTRSYGGEHGSLQQYRDDAGNFAVIDTDGEFVTINWSTDVRASEFRKNVASLQDVGASHVTLGLVGEELMTVDYETLVGISWDSEFDQMCNFLRLDVSETRTLEWQALVAAGRMPVTGLGDSVAAFREGGDLQAVLYDFMAKTARADTLIDQIMKALERLDLM